MTAKTKQGNAHARLEELRQQAAEQRVRSRELQARIERVEVEAQQAAEAVIEAHANEDPEAVVRARQAEDEALRLGQDLVAEMAGAAIRVERAQAEVDRYIAEHSKALVDERVDVAQRVAHDLEAKVREVLRLHRQLISERQEQDRILSAASSNPRMDGAPASYEWEQALNALARTVAEHPTITAPAPRWAGKREAAERDRVARELQEQRS